jgi:TPR repeat protein
MYVHGEGVSEDHAEAINGTALSQNTAPPSRGIQQDYAEALKWYRLAAD